MKKSLKIALVLVVILFIVLKVLQPSNSKSSGPENLISPEKRKIENVLLLSGFIVPDKSVQVKSHVSGIIEDIYVKEGQRLKKGDKIASVRLKPDPMALEQAKNRLDLAKLEVENLKDIFNRRKELFDDKILPEDDIKKLEQELRVAEANLSSAKRQYEILLKGFSSKSSFVDNDIVATASGTVMDIKVKLGAWVNASNNYNPGDVICEIADLEALKFKGEVDEIHVAKLSLSMPVHISVNALTDKPLESKIEQIDFDGIEENGIVKFGIECNINLDKQLIMRSGYSASAKVVLESSGEEKVMSVPLRAVGQSIDGRGSYMVRYKNDRMDTVYVKTGVSDGIYTQILGEISMKDRFVQ